MGRAKSAMHPSKNFSESPVAPPKLPLVISQRIAPNNKLLQQSTDHARQLETANRSHEEHEPYQSTGSRAAWVAGSPHAGAPEGQLPPEQDWWARLSLTSWARWREGKGRGRIQMAWCVCLERSATLYHCLLPPRGASSSVTFVFTSAMSCRSWECVGTISFSLFI